MHPLHASPPAPQATILLQHLQQLQHQGVSMAQPSHHQRQPAPNRGRMSPCMEEASLQQERAFSIITLLHAASAAALRQKLAQFATVLHISVLPMNPPAQVALGFKLQGFSFLQAQK